MGRFRRRGPARVATACAQWQVKIVISGSKGYDGFDLEPGWEPVSGNSSEILTQTVTSGTSGADDVAVGAHRETVQKCSWYRLLVKLTRENYRDVDIWPRLHLQSLAASRLATAAYLTTDGQASGGMGNRTITAMRGSGGVPRSDFTPFVIQVAQ